MRRFENGLKDEKKKYNTPDTRSKGPKLSRRTCYGCQHVRAKIDLEVRLDPPAARARANQREMANSFPTETNTASRTSNYLCFQSLQGLSQITRLTAFVLL